MGPLSVLDDHSRYLLVLRAVGSNHGALVREQLETVFASWGMPGAMLMDHGVPWWSATAPTGATKLTVWLMSKTRHPAALERVPYSGQTQEKAGPASMEAGQRAPWGAGSACGSTAGVAG